MHSHLCLQHEFKLPINDTQLFQKQWFLSLKKQDINEVNSFEAKKRQYSDFRLHCSGI